MGYLHLGLHACIGVGDLVEVHGGEWAMELRMRAFTTYNIIFLTVGPLGMRGSVWNL